MSKDNRILTMTAGEIAENDLDTRFRISNGNVWYEHARFSKSGLTVRLARLEQLPNLGLRQINRYVDPDTKMIVVCTDTVNSILRGDDE